VHTWSGIGKRSGRRERLAAVLPRRSDWRYKGDDGVARSRLGEVAALNRRRNAAYAPSDGILLMPCWPFVDVLCDGISNIWYYSAKRADKRSLFCTVAVSDELLLRRAVGKVVRALGLRLAALEVLVWIGAGIVYCSSEMVLLRCGVPRVIGTPISATVLFGSLIFGTAMTFLMFRKRVYKEVRISLIHSGVPVCLRCGYSLRGIIGTYCPECGAAREIATE